MGFDGSTSLMDTKMDVSSQSVWRRQVFELYKRLGLWEKDILTQIAVFLLHSISFFFLSIFFSNFLLLILAPTSVPPENYFSFSTHNVWAISNVLVLNKLFQLEWPWRSFSQTHSREVFFALTKSCHPVYTLKWSNTAQCIQWGSVALWQNMAHLKLKSRSS